MELSQWLRRAQMRIVSRLVSAGVGIVEGRVSSHGPQPYRRLDYGDRALLYIRCRPKKRAVRIDISGFWPLPYRPDFAVRAANGSWALIIRNAEEVEEAIDLVVRVVRQRKAA